jgi:hypothetical protein
MNETSKAEVKTHPAVPQKKPDPITRAKPIATDAAGVIC